MSDEGASLGLASARSVEELKRAASVFARSIGCENFSYLMTRLPRHRVACGEVFISSYPAEWMARYLARTYQCYDPVVSLSRKARVPYFWGQRGFLRAYNKAERNVFYEAGEFGILEGYSVPMVGPELDAGVFSVVVRERNEISDIVNGEIGELQIFATTFHDAVVRVAGLTTSHDDVILTSREMAVLKWTADGYSSEAVAARLGLSTSAINYHITNSCRKLGASNKIQAVALAIRMNII